MGNHYSNHKMVYEVSILRPGIVILHDLVLRDFIYGYHHAATYDPNWLARHFLYNEGPSAAPLKCVAGQRRRDEILEHASGLQFPMFKSLLRRCLGVIVHSEYSRQRVAAAIPSPVVMLDFPPHGPCAIHGHETAPRQSHPSGKVRLLTFGVLNPNKLIHNVIEQIGQSPCLCANVTYTIIGEGQHSYEQQLRDLIKTYDLSKVVYLAGRLSDHDLWRQLTQADLVVNLRNPHMGESSGTLLNALFAARPSLSGIMVVTRNFPDDAVYKISSEDELVPALETLCRDRSLLSRMGANARRHALERFDTAVYCRRFREFAVAVQSTRPVLELTDLLSDRLLEFGQRAPDGLVARLAEEVAALAGTTAKKTTSLAA